ncbi:hypothetical protein FNV43_RR11961 [Rhamnella rubrinervis]|uniref:Uncharacterized protein n=1 Tax=Rhamnella rubrinervis TaxID=2594499 RepID=A0A8K0MI41_9ROSA|nr:hypothetical protein FNV43_RR11961 [Rhamnella rubrinervis]
MGWLVRESRGGRQSWTEQTLASLLAAPLPLVTIVGIVVILLSMSSYTSYRVQMRRNMIFFKLLLFLLPLILIFVATSISKYGRYDSGTKQRLANQYGDFPWGVVVLLVLLLLMISYQPYFKSKWWPPVSCYYY